MNKPLIFGCVFLLIIMMGLMFFGSSKPKKIDWEESYNINHKKPFGLYILNQEINNFFENQKVTKLKTTAYEFFNNSYQENDTLTGTYLHINNEDDLDESSIDELFYFAEEGNTVFLSNQYFSKKLQDSLKFEMIINNYDTKNYSLCNEKFKNTNFIPKKNNESTYFSKIDTLKTKVLGYQLGDTKQINFIKVAYGQGYFILHTAPIVFTNLSLLDKNNYRYTEDVLSYIPKDNIYWDVKKIDTNNSILKVIYNSESLKTAWYLFLIGMFLFIIFNIKRRQRIVPIIKPLENTTVDFAKTISNLYYQEKNYTDLINKKINYFLEKVRSEYFIDTSKLDDVFIKKLHQKSGKDIHLINHLIELINNHRINNFDTEKDLIEINKLIEKIF